MTGSLCATSLSYAIINIYNRSPPKYYLSDLSSELTSEDSSQVVKDDFYLVSDNCHPLHLKLKLQNGIK